MKNEIKDYIGKVRSRLRLGVYAISKYFGDEDMIPHEWCPIECSSIRRVKVEPNKHDQRGDLLVEFNEGKVYRYADVPFSKIENLVHHPDPGRYFHGHIRNVHDGKREEE